MAELRGPVIRRIAEMICGDQPYGVNFPYRSSSFLTEFFDDLWLNHRHDGSTRRYWVESVLKEEAADGWSPEKYILTSSMRKIIGHLMDPIHFKSNDQYNAALADLNNVLAHDKLQVVIDPVSRTATVVDLSAGESKVISQNNQTLSSLGVAIVAPKAFDLPQQRLRNVTQCGILMPFGGLFDEIYEKDIAPVVREVGMEPLRADELWRDEKVINDIVDMIFNSSIIIADLSNKNANVFYELGIAHLLGRSVVPIVQNPEDVPFDLRQHRYLQYAPTTNGRQELRLKLGDRLKSLSNPS